MAVLATGGILPAGIPLRTSPGKARDGRSAVAVGRGRVPLGLGSISEVNSTWRFGTQTHLDTSVTPTYFKIEVSKYLGQTVNYTPFAYCAEISKLINKVGSPGPFDDIPTVTYELVPLKNIGYYSVKPAVLPSAESIFNGGDPGIGTEKAKLVQGLADTSYAASSASDITKAAFQLALWKIVSEDIGGMPNGPGSIASGNWSFNQETPPGGADGIISGFPVNSGGNADPDYYDVMTTAQSYLTLAIGEANNPKIPDIEIHAVTTATTGTSPLFYEQDLLILRPHSRAANLRPRGGSRLGGLRPLSPHGPEGVIPESNS